MTYLTIRTAAALLKGTAFLLRGLLFGVLPLVAIIAYKVAKGGVKVTMWTFSAVIGRAA